MTASNAVPWVFTDCTIADNGQGIHPDNSGLGTCQLTMSGCRIVHNTGSGVFSQHAVVAASLHGCTISRNSDDGVHLIGDQGSTFSISDSVIDGNADDGIYLENLRGCASLTADSFEGYVRSCRIYSNGDDGIDIGGNGTGCSFPNDVSQVTCGLVDNAIVGNVGNGVVERAGSSTIACKLGFNILSDNTAGNESGTGTGGVCSGTTSSENQTYN